jgi:hypothetical protein
LGIQAKAVLSDPIVFNPFGVRFGVPDMKSLTQLRPLLRAEFFLLGGSFLFYFASCHGTSPRNPGYQIVGLSAH